jgi:hypothetical protein
LLDTPHGATFEVRLPLPAPGASET